jgi:tetraacyldisaccharide 4'-kinase
MKCLSFSSINEQEAMNFNNFFLRSFRVLLMPFALLYGFIIFCRNKAYDKGWFKSASFNFPIICVGNLAVGGTGKSPMTEYIIRVLSPSYSIGTLSRGYKRKTRGYALANAHTTALEIGDEPMQFHLKFPEVAVAVGEERIVAIPQLLQDKPQLEAIILDDAFQHRTVKAGLNIVLTEYSNLFTDDFFLPSGDLRDERRSYKRANILVVTKCPPNLTQEKRETIIRKIQPLPHQQLFFTAIEYGNAYHILNNADEWVLTPSQEILLVCGIANPQPLKKFLSEQVHTYYQKTYSDHHIFSIDDLKEINTEFQQIQSREKAILTTEKDAVRLLKFKHELVGMPLFVLPIRHKFLFNEGNLFNQKLISFVKDFSSKKNNE